MDGSTKGLQKHAIVHRAAAAAAANAAVVHSMQEDVHAESAAPCHTACYHVR